MKKKMMFVDEALSMGGSMVVLSRVAKELPGAEYEKILVSPLSGKDLQEFFPSVRSFRLSKLMNYARLTHIQNAYYSMPSRHLVRVMTYFLSAIAFLCNMPYYMIFSFILVREKPDLVHINNCYAALAVSVLFHKQIVFHLHRPYPSLNIIHRFLFRRVDTFIAVSEYVKQSLPMPDKGRVQVLHNPVEKKTCQQAEVFRQRFGIEPGNKVVAIFGRLVRWKGHREFLQALQKVVVQDSAVLGMVVGGDLEYGGGYENELKEYVNELGIAGHVLFTGHVRDVACMYEISDIVVHASIKPEAFGLVIVEAMSFGKPVIVSDLGAPREILEDGAGGFIVNPHDTEFLAGKIMLLLKDRKLYDRFAQINRILAEEYSLKAYIQRIEELYEQLFAAGQSSRGKRLAA